MRQAAGGYDKSASGATRVAGTENFKLKYAPAYPVVTIKESHPGRAMTPETLEQIRLLASVPQPVKAAELKFTRRLPSRSCREKQWQSYKESLARAGPNQDGTGPDRSTAEFWWCYFALKNGYSKEETEAKRFTWEEALLHGFIHHYCRNATAAPLRAIHRIPSSPNRAAIPASSVIRWRFWFQIAK